MVHCFKINGKNMVLDVNSDCFYEVSDPAFYVIKKMSRSNYFNVDDMLEAKNELRNQYSQHTLDAVCKEILELFNKRMFFSKDEYEDFEIPKAPIKALCLNVTYSCNLSCKYCFANGAMNETQHQFMNIEIAKKALDFLVKSSMDKNNLEIDFFGGEPLLNFDVVKKTVEYGNQLSYITGKNFRFTITTNATLLDDDRIEFINKHMHNVVLSLDGLKETNDKMRVLKSGEGTYEDTVKKIKRLLASRSGKSYYVRGTYTRHNKNFLKDVLHLFELGFNEVSLEPVVAKECDYAFSNDDLRDVLEEYERAANFCLERRQKGLPGNFFRFSIDCKRTPCIIKRLRGCGVGREYLCVVPNGDIYPCHQLVKKQFLLGNVVNGIERPDIIELFNKNSIYSKDKCKKCFAKFHCCGGCMANSYNINEDFEKPYEIACEIQKKCLECALYINSNVKEGE